MELSTRKNLDNVPARSSAGLFRLQKIWFFEFWLDKKQTFRANTEEIARQADTHAKHTGTHIHFEHLCRRTYTHYKMNTKKGEKAVRIKKGEM